MWKFLNLTGSMVGKNKKKLPGINLGKFYIRLYKSLLFVTLVILFNGNRESDKSFIS